MLLLAGTPTAAVCASTGMARACETAWTLAGAGVGGIFGDPEAGAKIGRIAGDVFSPACIGDRYRHALLDIHEVLPMLEICLDHIRVSRVPPSDTCSTAPGKLGGEDASSWRDGFQMRLGDVLNIAGSVLVRHRSSAGKDAFECVATLSPRFFGADTCIAKKKKLPVAQALENARKSVVALQSRLERAYQRLIDQRRSEIALSANVGGMVGLGAVGFLLWSHRRRRPAEEGLGSDFLNLTSDRRIE